MAGMVLRENWQLGPTEPQKLKGNKVSGVFSKADVRNANGRVYRTKLWEKILRRPDIKQALKDRTMLGELGHPDIVDTTLKDVSHIVTRLELRPNGDVYGEAEILDTPSGRILKTLYEAGVKMGISSRGYLPEGSCLMPEGEDMIVPDDYELLTFDFVLTPSSPGAYPTVSESTKKTLQKLLVEGKGKIGEDVVSFVEGLNTSSGMTVLKEAEQQYQKNLAAAKLKEGKSVPNSSYVKRLENVVAELSERYKVAEGVISDLLSDRKASTDLLDDVSRRYLTSESLIKDLRDYAKQLETTLTEVSAMQKVSEEVIADLVGRCKLSEDVVNDIRSRYLTAEQVIDDLRARHTLAEGVIENLAARHTMSEQDKKDPKAVEAAMNEAKELQTKLNLSEEVIQGLRDRLQEASTPKRRPIPAGYFEGIAQKYGIHVDEAKRLFKEMGCRQKAFEFHMEERKRLSSAQYRSLPYMKESAALYGVTPGKTPEQHEQDRLARLVASQF